MDVEWALAELRKYQWLHERVPLPPEEADEKHKTAYRGTLDERKNQAHTVETIAQAVYGKSVRWFGARDVHRLIWELTEGDAAREKLGLNEEPEPAFQANKMHPWVWEAARPHWTSGNDRAALWAAAINVNSRLQAKVGRKDLGESKLLREVFSTEAPREGRARLRLCDESNPDLFKDMHVGASSLGQGLFAAVRNPLNHVTEDEHDLSEAESLEALAAFSLLARWIERAAVVSVD